MGRYSFKFIYTTRLQNLIFSVNITLQDHQIHIHNMVQHSTIKETQLQNPTFSVNITLRDHQIHIHNKSEYQKYKIHIYSRNEKKTRKMIPIPCSSNIRYPNHLKRSHVLCQKFSYQRHSHDVS